MNSVIPLHYYFTKIVAYSFDETQKKLIYD